MEEKNNPLISIALATYNGDRYLVEQLESIYNQTYRNIEVVVSDDHSSDDTIKILQVYKQKKGLKFTVNQNKLGIVKNFENAISKCSGEYILLSDQDDVWMPSKIETLVHEIGEFSLIYSDGLILSNTESKGIRISKLNWMIPFSVDSNNENFFKYLLFNSFVLGCSMMFKKELLKTAMPFFENYRNHDWWLVFCAECQNGVKYINVPLFHYRIHDDNCSILPQLSLFDKVFLVFSRNRVDSRILLQKKDREIYNYLFTHCLYRNSFQKVIIDETNDIYGNNTGLIQKMKFLFFLIKWSNFIFPKNKGFEKYSLILLRFIERL